MLHPLLAYLKILASSLSNFDKLSVEWAQHQQGPVEYGPVVVLVGWDLEVELDLQGLDLDSDLQDPMHLD